MTGRENRKQRREAERKARKLGDKQEQMTSAPPPSPDAEQSAASQLYPNLPARLAEMRAKADRELEDEFGAEFVAHSREVSDRMARRIGLDVPPRPRAEADTASWNGFSPTSPRGQTNRQNSQLSTGPRTEQGKLASSRNSLKHGLSTGALLIPGEDLSAFEALRDALRREHQPADATEQLLVDGIAQSHWLLQRALRFQNECFTAEAVDEKRLALFLRYGATHERAFHKALSALLRLQKERRKGQPIPRAGFVSQTRSPFPAQSEMPGFVSQLDSPPALQTANLGRMNARN